MFDENGAYLSDGIDSRYATIGMIAVNLNQIGRKLEEAGNGRLPDHHQCPQAPVTCGALAQRGNHGPRTAPEPHDNVRVNLGYRCRS